MQSEFALPREVEDRIAAEVLAPDSLEPGMHAAEIRYSAAYGFLRQVKLALRRRGVTRDQRRELHELDAAFTALLECSDLATAAWQEQVTRTKLVRILNEDHLRFQRTDRRADAVEHGH